jgi:asparagine synthase (glutamine-hydrolysing)
MSDATWQAMLDDVRAESAFRRPHADVWRDAEGEARLACVGGSILVTDACAVAVDGWLEGEASTESIEARVIAAYVRHGAACLRSLRGEIAFVLWDRRARRLVAACDPVGTRALAYARAARALLVSSRALALLRDPRVGRAWNEPYVADVLCHARAQPPGVTPFASIRRVRPGFALVAEREGDGGVEEREVDRLDLRGGDAREAEDAVYTDFWRTFEAAVHDRTSSRTCATLSGGLDSSLVAACAARVRGRIDAFTMRAGTAADATERALVTSLVHAHPGIALHPVDIDRALGITNASTLTDDPITSAPALAAARATMIRAIRDAGFDAALDGEGGDEVFDLAVRLLDLPRAHQWRELARYLRERGRVRLRPTVWRQLIVPSLPRSLLALWLTRERRRVDPIPPWMNDAFRAHAPTEEALAHAYAAPLTSFEEALRWHLGSSSAVGARQSLAREWRAHGITLLSPLLDRRILERVARVPPHMRIDARRSKAFLRRAARGVLPDDVALAPKELSSYDARQIASLRARDDVVDPILRAIARCPPVRDFVDMQHLIDALGNGAHAAYRTRPTHLRESLFALLGFVAWHGRVREEYGLD